MLMLRDMTKIHFYYVSLHSPSVMPPAYPTPYPPLLSYILKIYFHCFNCDEDILILGEMPCLMNGLHASQFQNVDVDVSPSMCLPKVVHIAILFTPCFHYFTFYILYLLLVLHNC